MGNYPKYYKINTFIETMTIKEKKYMVKKLQQNIFNEEFGVVNFTINSEKIN